MDDDADSSSGLPSRPRSDLERSSVQSALIASLDFHTAVHGHAATMALMTSLLPQINATPQSPPPERRVSTTAPRKFVKSQEPQQERGLLLKGPSWADMSSDEDDAQ